MDEDGHPAVSSKRKKGSKQCAWEEKEGDRLDKAWKPTCPDHTVYRRGGYCDAHKKEQDKRNQKNSRAKKQNSIKNNLLVS